MPQLLGMPFADPRSYDAAVSACERASAWLPAFLLLSAMQAAKKGKNSEEQEETSRNHVIG